MHKASSETEFSHNTPAAHSFEVLSQHRERLVDSRDFSSQFQHLTFCLNCGSAQSGSGFDARSSGKIIQSQAQWTTMVVVGHKGAISGESN